MRLMSALPPPRVFDLGYFGAINGHTRVLPVGQSVAELVEPTAAQRLDDISSHSIRALHNASCRKC
jgi:hypothetical protein